MLLFPQFVFQGVHRVGYTYKWSKLELAGATFQESSTSQNMTSCEGIMSLQPLTPILTPTHDFG